jgi:hypothetical protein
MMEHIAISIDEIPIRLTLERWFHIVANHDDLASYVDDVLETIENPLFILRGYRGSLMAVRNDGHQRYLVVVYRQISSHDGFIITAYFTSHIDKKKILWQRP